MAVTLTISATYYFALAMNTDYTKQQTHSERREREKEKERDMSGRNRAEIGDCIPAEADLEIPAYEAPRAVWGPDRAGREGAESHIPIPTRDEAGRGGAGL